MLVNIVALRTTMQNINKQQNGKYWFPENEILKRGESHALHPWQRVYLDKEKNSGEEFATK